MEISTDTLLAELGLLYIEKRELERQVHTLSQAIAAAEADKAEAAEDS